MDRKLFILTTLFFMILISCSKHEKVYIVTGKEEVVKEAGKELGSYLEKTYPHNTFEMAAEKNTGSRNIVLEISGDTGSENDEAYRISGEENILSIRGRTPLAISNGVYGLLKEIGWQFYVSFEVPPINPKPLDFKALKTENEPLKKTRIILNWHAYLTGCSSWDYEQWQEWIDNSRKIGYNTIMVHAYGNNPMCSFSYNNKEKELGYLSTTLRGRDWGTEHVNDVRLLYGGEIFTDYEFGPKVAKVPDNERSTSVTGLMQQVFKHAAWKGMGVCFAYDMDTWMSNPQSIINTLPEEALIKSEGYKMVNPEHPEGRKYYKALLQKLFNDYPEITILAAWMRQPLKDPASYSIWLKPFSNALPAKWRGEYFTIMKTHPELKDERPYPGLFAISKVIKVYREILDEIKPGVELTLGSWNINFPEQASVFMPGYCGYMPLGYFYNLDQPEVNAKLSKAGKDHNMYPITYLQFDDFGYYGRPFKPYENFNAILNGFNSKGYGSLHWSTHPLDLSISNFENQLWKNSENESYEKCVTDFTRSLSKREDKNLQAYFKEWFLNAPMFGYEGDNFLDMSKEYSFSGYSSSLQVVEKAKKRLDLLNSADVKALSGRGLKEYNYYLGMEKFIVSVFTNHNKAHQAFMLLKDGKRNDAIPLVKQLNPSETIERYGKTLKQYGATRGEEASLLTLNLHWLTGYIDLRQMAGIEPVRVNFQPTKHDPLAQGRGRNTYFIDKNKNIWLSEGEKELSCKAETNGKLPLENIYDSWIDISAEQIIPLKTMKRNTLPASDYEIELFLQPQTPGCEVQLFENGKTISTYRVEKGQDNPKWSFSYGGGEAQIKIIAGNGTVKLSGLTATAK